MVRRAGGAALVAAAAAAPPPGVPAAAQCVALGNGTLSCADLRAGPECYYQPVLGEQYLSYTLDVRERLPALWCLVAFSLAVSSASLVVLVVFRDRAVVRMSQWAFALVATCGLVALNVGGAVKLAGIFSTNSSGGDRYCMVFLSLFYLGEQAIFMAFLSKTLRAWRLHENSRRLRPNDFHAWHGWVMLGVGMLVVAVLLAVWFTVRPPSYSTCERLNCEDPSNPFHLAIWVINFATLVSLVIAAVVARKVHSVASESLSILVASVIFIAIIVTLAILLYAEHSLSLGQQILAYLIGVLICTCAASWSMVFSKVGYYDLSAEQVREAFLLSLDPLKTAARREQPAQGGDNDKA